MHVCMCVCMCMYVKLCVRACKRCMFTLFGCTHACFLSSVRIRLCPSRHIRSQIARKNAQNQNHLRFKTDIHIHTRNSTHE